MSGRNFWGQQATWFIDPVGGNDEASGIDAGHAIKTCAERIRRVGVGGIVPQATTINYLNSPSASDVEVMSKLLIGVNSTLTLQGTRTVAATGTLTGFTAFNRAAQTKNSIQDTSIDFSTHVGRLCRITSGARLNVAWIITKDLGSHAAEISTPGTTNPASFGSFARGTPQVGDPYEIVTIPKIAFGEMSFGQAANQYPTTGFGRVIAQDLEFDFGNLSTTSFASGCIADFAKLIFVRCKFGPTSFRGNTVSLYQTYHTGYAFIDQGSIQFRAGAHSTHVQANNGGRASLDFDQLLEGGQIAGFRGGYIEVGTACAFNKTGDGVGINPGCTLLCSPAGDTVTALWGTGNTGRGVNAPAGANVIWYTGTGGARPTINAGLGLGRELMLGGDDFVWTDAPVQAGGAVAGTFQ